MTKLRWILIGVFFVLLKPPLAYAQSGLGCSVSVSPSSVSPSASATLNFNVTNNGTPDIVWVWIGQEGEDVLTVQSGSSAGWSILEESTGMVLFGGGTIPSGSSSSFAMNIASPSTVGAIADWKIMVSNFEGGNETVDCIGNSQVTIESAGASTPVLLNVSLTVGNSSATLTWNTDFSATGTVNYGTTSGYGSSTTTASGTVHSATLSGLSASTTYHYQIQVTGEGGTTSTADATFTTSAASVTTTTTTTVTNTKTETISSTVILSDTVKPVVKIDTKTDKAMTVAPIIEGKVVDTGAINAGIAKIQYSIDDGKNWLLIDEPNGARSASFNFVPEIYDDGNYVLLVKATDLTGNTGVSSKQTLVIDRLPPKIIHSVWRVGPIVLSAPYPLLPGVTTNVSIQAIGGVIELSLIINEQEYKFNKNSENGLWEGEILLNQKTIEALKQLPVIVRARDGGDNKIEEEMGNISQVGESVTAQDAKISVYKFDDTTGRFKIWNGAIYGQNNPEMSKSTWFLPAGRYHLKAVRKGYQNGVSQIFEVESPAVVSIKTSLDKLGIGNFWRRKNLAISHTGIVISKQEMELKGKTIKWVEENKFIGKDIKLHIIPSWDPRIAALLAGLTSDEVVVLPGSNQSSVDMLKMRGGYKPVMVADPDGLILSDLKGLSMPTTLSINRRGVVE